MPKAIPLETKQEARRLRREDRLGGREIARRCGVSLATVSKWVQDDPLTQAEITQRHRFGNGKKKGRAIKEVLSSDLYRRFGQQRVYSSNEKGRIAETAVLLRLHLLKHEVYGSTYGGDRYDWVVSVAGKLIKVQVRWARWYGYGAPCISTTRSDGRHDVQGFTADDLDVLVGYDLVTDTAYVYSFAEIVGNKRLLSMRDDAAEKWDKLLSV